MSSRAPIRTSDETQGSDGADVPRLNMPAPGTAAGIEASELGEIGNAAGPVTVTVVDYCPGQVEIEEIKDLPEFLARHRPAWSHVRWINVDGLGRMDVIQALAEKYRSSSR